MSLPAIRDSHRVPAFKGARVRWHSCRGPRLATIVGSYGVSLRIKVDGEPDLATVHPTARLEYLPATAKARK